MKTVIARRGPGKWGTEIQVGSHRLVSDPAQESGGADAGPTPHELLGAALAACTAMTVRMYAGRKGWPLDDVEVAVDVEGEGPSKRILRRLTLRGALDDEQRKRLLDIADHCPVHKTIEVAIPIESSLV